MNSVILLIQTKDPNVKRGKRTYNRFEILILEREREYLLSKITGDSTVEIRRDKKESRSTQ